MVLSKAEYESILLLVSNYPPVFYFPFMLLKDLYANVICLFVLSDYFNAIQKISAFCIRYLKKPLEYDWIGIDYCILVICCLDNVV